MTRSALLAMLEQDEGRRRFVYDDATGEPIKKGSVVKGNPTIGIGCELSMTGLTDEEIDYLAENRVGRCEAELDRRWPWWRSLSEARQRVLVSMVFQMGAAGVSRFPKFLAALQRGDYAEAAAEMKDSAWAKQTPARCERLARLMEQG
jgi:lysozyme